MLIFAASTPVPASAGSGDMFFLLCLAAGVLSILPAFKPRIKGFIGEHAVHRVLMRLGPGYKVYRDLYLPKPNGDGTTQVDHIVVSVHGVFVVETKNYKGWIFGSEHDQTWTQSLKGGRLKHRFQNPLKQNKLHVDALRKALNLPGSCFHSVVYFTGESVLKTSLPENVIQSNLRNYILQHRAPLLTSTQVNAICTSLNSFANNKARLKSLHRPGSRS